MTLLWPASSGSIAVACPACCCRAQLADRTQQRGQYDGPRLHEVPACYKCSARLAPARRSILVASTLTVYPYLNTLKGVAAIP